ncbi:MAG: VUT family protein [Erysipelotrichaceae bacterium]|jgi:hypothetical protein|nr:VUT family protein [Erysipelotrichaceae bacterium]
MSKIEKGAFKRYISRQAKESKLLFRSIPSYVVAFFVVSVIAMNLLANKTIVNETWIALDGGILISWLSFLCMDVVTKHFGPHAANKMTLFAVLVNLLTSLIFFIVSIIPTKDDYSIFNQIVGGTWFILLSSTVAFIASGILNNFLNYSTGKLFKKNPDGKLAFVTRCYISTFIGQFVDNFIFSILTFMVFAPIFWDGFSWTFIQVLMCSITGAVFELLMEIIFSPLGYMTSARWKREGVGESYFLYLKENSNENIDYRN